MTNEHDEYTARTEAFLDCLRTRRDPAADPRALPDLLASLAWTIDDNGHALERVRERWLREGDLERTELAFAMDDVFPGRTRAEIAANVGAAAQRFPQLAARAEAILAQWDAGAGSRQEGRAPFWTLAWDRTAPMSPAEAAEFLAEHPAPNAPPKFLAEILDELLPCLTAEAQAELHAVADAWAAGPDAWRAAIAAWMEVPGPGRTREDLAARRAAVIGRHPRAASADHRW